MTPDSEGITSVVVAEREHIALALANSVDHRFGGNPVDRLESYESLVGWACSNGVLTPAESAVLIAASERDRDGSERVLHRAVELRESCFALFHAASRDLHYPPRQLEILHGLYYEMTSHRVLTPGAGRIEWTWTGSDTDLDRILWPIVDAATELLTSDALARVRTCQGENCSRLFLDFSRQGNRRWCDMKRCGNREKAKRFYRKKREA